MNRRTLSLAVCGTVLAIAGACTDASAPRVASDLVGRWVTDPVDLSPNGWYETRLSFGSDGSYVFEVRDYGFYPGQTRDILSAYTVIEGTYRVDGDSIHRTARRETTWDSFYGMSSAPTVRAIDPSNYFLNTSSKYTIVGSRLILDYYTYPADAPVETRMVLNKR